ncbi:S-layer homology domain-containing protein [Halobacillus seohaensis]|uniref:S-layer homology domain-containing protein n=1 Tax=Halobacillus seohaensis TaxID=447421 RepID=A0ABW2EPI3_9BACI
MKKIVWSFAFAIFLTFLAPHSSLWAQSFQDVDSVPWAVNSIDYLSERGIINGYDSRTFGPNDEITRSQASLMLVNELYPEEQASQSSAFPDVPQSNPYYNAITVASEKELMEGYLDGSFQPGDPITRAETAVLIDTAYEIERGEDALSFDDTYSVPWALHSILDLSSQQIIKGYHDGSFRPNESITRAEFAVVLASTLNPDLNNDSSEDSPSENHELQAFEEEVVNLTNEEREKRGLNTLSIDPKLSKVAWHKSEDMNVNNYFSHQSPTYGSPFDMMDEFGVNYSLAAENIAKGHTSPEEVVEGWMNSPGHKKNILRDGITHIGVGYENRYWTQLFTKK